jgi:hypothetical protein
MPTAPATTSPTGSWATPSPSWNTPAWPAACPPPPIPPPHHYGATSAEYDDWQDATARGDLIHPSPALADYLAALDQHQRANYGAEVIPVHKLWTNDGWLLTPDELDAALQHAPARALDGRQRPIPWWRQWLEYLDTARGHGGVRVH